MTKRIQSMTVPTRRSFKSTALITLAAALVFIGLSVIVLHGAKGQIISPSLGRVPLSGSNGLIVVPNPPTKDPIINVPGIKSLSGVLAVAPSKLSCGIASTGGTIALKSTAQFTGSISGTTLTVTAISQGMIGVGDLISGTLIAPKTHITAFGTGNSGTGTYQIDFSQTAASGAISGSTGKRVHTLNSSSTFNAFPLALTCQVSYLIVAGGANGAPGGTATGVGGAGGNGGQVKTGSININLGSYAVTVGGLSANSSALGISATGSGGATGGTAGNAASGGDGGDGTSSRLSGGAQSYGGGGGGGGGCTSLCNGLGAAFSGGSGGAGDTSATGGVGVIGGVGGSGGSASANSGGGGGGGGAGFTSGGAAGAGNGGVVILAYPYP